jgi:ParB family chromosome partitioning protein
MKIDINNIDEGRFVIRDENNEEYVAQLAASLKEDGQWVPIIVRPKPEGRYEVIAGHYRLHAAKKAGFTEIEATVRDLLDEYADILSLKTNMLRLEMTPREQGQVLAKMQK